MVMIDKKYGLLLLLISVFGIGAATKDEQYYDWYPADKTSGTQQRNEKLNSLKDRIDVLYKNLWGNPNFFVVRENGADVIITKPLYDRQIADWEKLIDEIKIFITELHPKLVARKTKEEIQNNVFVGWERLIENIKLLDQRKQALADNEKVSKSFYQDPLNTLDIFLKELEKKLPIIYKRINTSGFETFKTTLRARELAGYVAKKLEETIQNLQKQIDTIKKTMTVIESRKKQEENMRGADATIRKASKGYNPFLPQSASLDLPMAHRVPASIASVAKIAREDTRSFKEIIEQYRLSDQWKSIKNNQFDRIFVKSGYDFFDRKNEKTSAIDFSIGGAKRSNGKEKLTYKIHLQVKKQYVLQCMHILLDALNNDKRLAGINSFKIKDNLDDGASQMPQIALYMPNFIIPYDDLTAEQKASVVQNPMVVQDDIVYENPYDSTSLTPIGKIKSVQECNRELDIIVQALYEAFRGVNLREWALDYPPRYNMQLTLIMYIAGGNGDYKKNEPEVYTTDKHFVKNREYVPNNGLKALLDSTMHTV
jgi:hypothetical protein